MIDRSDFEFLLKVSRPKLWPPMLLLILSAYGLADQSIGFIELAILSVFTLPANLVVYGLNDLYDCESDRHNERKEEKNVRENYSLLRNSILISSLAGLVISASTGKPEVLAGCVLWLTGSYAYSVPPVRLKERPPLDAWTNSLYVIAPGLMSFGLTGMKMPAELLWIGAATPGGHVFTTIPDYEADRKAGQTTFALRFGKKAAAAYALLSGLALLFLAPIESGVFQTYIIFAILTGLYTSFHLTERKVLERAALMIYTTGTILGIGYVLSVFGVI